MHRIMKALRCVLRVLFLIGLSRRSCKPHAYIHMDRLLLRNTHQECCLHFSSSALLPGRQGMWSGRLRRLRLEGSPQVAVHWRRVHVRALQDTRSSTARYHYLSAAQPEVCRCVGCGITYMREKQTQSYRCEVSRYLVRVFAHGGPASLRFFL